jgi:mRNA interferase RelE/StbE
MYTISIGKRERKLINNIPAGFRQRVEDAINELKNNAYPSGCEKLTNARECWRIKTGQYRVAYRVDDKEKVVTIVEAGHRDKFYPRGANR